MYVSLMAYSQGGNINIVNNHYYNSNHIAEIRGGTSNGKYVLDIHFVGIDNPTNVKITKDGNGLNILDNPIFNPTDDLTGKVSISGKVIGISSTKFPIYYSDKVGIGTTSPDYALDVAGTIRACEVKVNLNSGECPDYVFADNYDLMSLDSLEQYVNKNKHLPKINPSETMESEGLNLKDINIKLLEKIEEISLYMIDMNKRVKLLENENKVLKEKITKLEFEE